MLLNFALQYLAKGWSIIPLEYKGKEPLVATWKEFETRLPTEQEVREWWTKWPTANIAIVTGSTSGIAVVDIDGPEGEEQAKPFNLPPTVSVKTGKGRHLYYKHPGVPVKTCRAKLAAKIDIRGDGGYVAAPYSVHENGNRYAWLGGFASITNELAPFPSNVLGMLGNSGSTQTTSYTEVKPQQEPWVTELLKGVGEGEKHNAVIRLSGYFNAKGLPLDVAKALLLDWNTRNTPPAESEGVIQRVEDVYKRYPQGVLSKPNNEQRAQSAPINITTPRAAYAGFRDELKKGAKTIPTGYSVLDREAKGLLVGNLSVIGAWPGVGKTAFTLGLARQLAEQGFSVLYFPTEMAVNELMRVFVSSGLQIPFKRVFEGDLTEQEHEKAAQYLEGNLLSKLHIVENTSPTLSDIVAAVEQAKPQVFMLDYIQHTKGATGGKRTDVEELVMGLKDLAKRTQSAGVITSQFHRPYKGSEGELIPPTMFDFAECGQIEREVSMALLMSPVDKERYSEAQEFFVNFNLAKNRFGKVQSFQLKFNQEYVRFSE